MEKKETKETSVKNLDISKIMAIEEEIYQYSAEDYNELLEEKPWRKEFLKFEKIL